MTAAPPRMFFFFFKVKPDVYFMSLSGKKREILIIFESKMQKLLSATANEGVHLEKISFKCPTVPRGVGGWSKMVKILSTWCVNDPLRFLALCSRLKA